MNYVKLKNDLCVEIVKNSKKKKKMDGNKDEINQVQNQPYFIPYRNE